MTRSAGRRSLRAGISLGLILVLAGGAVQAFAAKPPPKPPTLKVSAVVSGFEVTLRYQVNRPEAALGSQNCALTFPRFVTVFGCDSTPDSGSGSKLTKFSLESSTPQAGTYTFEVAIDLIGGGQVRASTTFSVAPGPAVGFSVTGLVEQPSVCYVGIDCAGFPNADYPRQIATITALDVNGNVATGYAGVITFENPITHTTPADLQNMTLTDGVAHVPVLVPSLPLGFDVEPQRTVCPPGPTGNGVVLTVADTLDPTMFGCQNIAGGSVNFVFPVGFFDAPSTECPTGCLSEPTDTLTIDTNTVTPSSLSSSMLPDGSILLTGQTIADLYFSQPLEIGRLYIEGPANPELLIACTGCENFNILVDGVHQTATTPVELAGSTITVTGCITFPEYRGIVTRPDGTAVEVGRSCPPDVYPPLVVQVVHTTTVQAPEPPKCYLEPQLLTLLLPDQCN